LAKQIPTSSQPIVPPPVPLLIETSGLEKEPSIPPGVNLPIATIKPTEILDNSSKANPQGQPIVQSMMENSFTIGMPQVPSTLNDPPMGNKIFNPIINGETLGYNLVGSTPTIPANINPPWFEKE
jgi:hypothetical protein